MTARGNPLVILFFAVGRSQHLRQPSPGGITQHGNAGRIDVVLFGVRSEVTYRRFPVNQWRGEFIRNHAVFRGGNHITCIRQRHTHCDVFIVIGCHKTAARK
jgi:hypothetical protein